MDENKEPAGPQDPSADYKNASEHKEPASSVALAGEGGVATKQAPDSAETANTSETAIDPPEPSRAHRLWLWVKNPKHSSAIQAIFTAVIMLTGIAYTIFAALQWSTMQGTLDEMRRSGQGTTDQINTLIGNLNWLARGMDGALSLNRNSAQTSQHQSQQALDTSIASFKQQERAYLAITSYSISQTPTIKDKSGLRVCVDVHYTNSGRTPAISILATRRATFGELVRNTPEGNPTFDDATPYKTIESLTVPRYNSNMGATMGTGGDHFVTAFTDPVTGQDANDIISGKRVIYAYGVIQYSDIFHEVHETGFCSKRLPNEGPWMGCDIGNWMDKRVSSNGKARH